VLARLGNRHVTLELVGEADSDGAPDANLPLSESRASRVLQMLQAQPFERVAMIATGVGSRNALDPSAPEDTKRRNRRVTFHVTLAQDPR
jgi:outer membrane protein OmpA-like peptidoglycan-associated protein